MVRMLTAYTREPDDVEAAVAEILEQLNLKEKLLKNSVGIMRFYGDFLETGVAKAISDALPFDVIGGTTSNASVPGAMGDIILVLTVLTSDDVSFKASVSAPLGKDTALRIKELYEDVASGLSKKPSLLLAIAPVMLSSFDADEICSALDAASGGVPLFGGLAITHKVDFSGIYTYFNGKAYEDVLPLVAIAGDITPRFYASTIPENRIAKQNAVITESFKNCVMKINGIDAVSYLESIGLVENGDIGGASAVPFILTMPDGSRVVRTASELVDGRGIRFFGAAPQGCEVFLSNCDVAFVNQSTREVLSTIAGNPDEHVVLCISCAGRRWLLGTRVNAEMQQVANRFDPSASYLFAYSGGEFCPVKNSLGEMVNRFHNFTFITCVF